MMRWNLKKSIHRSGLRQQDVVEKLAQVGYAISASIFSRITTGKKIEVDEGLQSAIAKILKVERDIIFGEPSFIRVIRHLNEAASDSEAEDRLLERLEEREIAFTEAIYDMVIFHEKIGNPKKAAAYLEVLIQPTDDLEERAWHYVSKGRLMEQQHEYRKAIAFYARALPLEPKNPQRWYFINNNLGYCLNQVGEYTRAEEYCRAAIQIASHRHNAYKNLAISLEGQGEFKDAVEAYVKATRLNPYDPRAFASLEDLLRREPSLLIENPELSEVLACCKKIVRRFSRRPD